MSHAIYQKKWNIFCSDVLEGESEFNKDTIDNIVQSYSCVTVVSTSQFVGYAAIATVIEVPRWPLFTLKSAIRRVCQLDHPRRSEHRLHHVGGCMHIVCLVNVRKGCVDRYHLPKHCSGSCASFYWISNLLCHHSNTIQVNSSISVLIKMRIMLKLM